MPYSQDPKKILGIQALIDLLGANPEKKVALTGGVFDFLKPYHIELFNFASDRNDILVVGVGSAGKYTSLEERTEILEAVENVDYLFTYSDETDLNGIGELVDEVIFNDEFEFPGDKISFSQKVIRFLP